MMLKLIYTSFKEWNIKTTDFKTQRVAKNDLTIGSLRVVPWNDRYVFEIKRDYYPKIYLSIQKSKITYPLGVNKIIFNFLKN